MIITLLSDFGTSDHFVAAMKGVILSRDDRIRIVDITHDVPPYDVQTAAFLLANCHRAFPAGTVHVAVVDPGVGSSRRPIVVRAAGHLFVGPDNGLFTPVLADESARVRLIQRSFGVREVSSTFHGRDVFAPAAAALASGLSFDRIGPPVHDPVRWESIDNHVLPDGYEGRILHVDRFGNCVTSFRTADLAAIDGVVTFHVGSTVVKRIVPYFQAAAPEEVCAVGGSAGYLELVVDGGSAAERLNARRGTTVVARVSATMDGGRSESGS